MPPATRNTATIVIPVYFSARGDKPGASGPRVYSRRLLGRDTTWYAYRTNPLSSHALTMADVPDRVDDWSASRASRICRRSAGTVRSVIFKSSQNDFFRT